MMMCTTNDDFSNLCSQSSVLLETAGVHTQHSIGKRNELVQQLTKFLFIGRLRGPLYQFCDGLKTLGVLDSLQKFPAIYKSFMCDDPKPLTPLFMEQIFHIKRSESGSNRNSVENCIIGFWRDFLLAVGDEDTGDIKLEFADILQFTTGCRKVPPLGFEPEITLTFQHVNGIRYPKAQTCYNELQLPLSLTYDDFLGDMTFGIISANDNFGLA